MNKRILGGLAAAVMLTGGLAISSSVAQATEGAGPLTVDGVVYLPTKIAGPTTHYETSDTNPESASNDDHVWDDNGFEKLPCPFGIHWLSNENTLNVSHCLDDPNTPPPVCDGDGDCVEPDPCLLGEGLVDDEIAATDDDCVRPTPVCEDDVDNLSADDQEQETRNLTGEKEQFECTKDPEVEVEETEWTDGKFECVVKTVEQTREITTTTTTYTWNGQGFNAKNTVASEQETRTRDLTEKEQLGCPITTPTPEISPVVVVIPPAAPTERPPSIVVSAFSPAQAPPAEVEALPPVIPAAGLPATGSNGTGVAALIALLSTSLGGAALLAARRRDVTT